MTTIEAGTKLGRYEIRSKIGEGGMGEVYLAQDTKLDRKVALKILPPDVAAHPDRMKRFVQEAKAASALNHPNIITIYEIDETDSGHFIATEYIDGETLRQHSLTGLLTLAESLDIAIQIANALAAAHAAGIVHRDIKPENVMVRRDGIAKVLDFGLAKLLESKESGPEEVTRPMLLTRTGVMMGTVTYMSPEQARGQRVDARSDIWSLGVVLYEIVAGHLPFDGPSNSDIIVSILEREPAPLSSLLSAVPTELQRIISKSLRKDREERYQSVRDLLVDLKSLRRTIENSGAAMSAPQPAEGSRQTVASANDALTSAGRSPLFAIARSKVFLALVAAILVVLTVAAYFLFVKSRSTLTEKDTILLADFVNTTGDATFDGSTLKQALAVQLRQTPFVNLLPEESVHETLRYMNRLEAERITKEIGSEICRRRGLKAMLVGSIASIGSNYAITIEAVNGQTGETITSQQVEAEKKEQVLKSLGQAALELRKQLGESLADLHRYNAPIEQATTSSLDALNVYSKGLEQIYGGDYKAALPLFKHAVELDPNFVEAYVWLSWTYANFGDFGQAAVFAEKAYALRDRGTELEKLRVDDIYHLWATGDTEKQKEADELIKRLYPNDWVPNNSLAISSLFYSGQIEPGLAEAREAARLNPNEVHTYKHISDALIRLNRFDEAREVIRQAQARKLDHTYYRRNLYLLALVQGDTAAMQQQLDLMTATDGEREALGWKARATTVLGRWHEAENYFNRIAELSASSTQTGKGSTLPLEATQRKALFGFCQPGGEGESQSFVLSRVNSPWATIQYFPHLPDGSLCGEISAAQKFIAEIARRYPKSTFANEISIPTLSAAIELKRNQPEQAIEYLKPTIPYEAAGHFIPNYLRGQAYLRLHRGAEAAAEFRKILDHRGWDVVSQLYQLAQLGLARALAMTGDMSGSRKAYQDSFGIWKDADADLPILIEAKKEYEKLN